MSFLKFCSFLILRFVDKNIQGYERAMAIKRTSVWQQAEQYDICSMDDVYHRQRTPVSQDLYDIVETHYETAYCIEHHLDSPPVCIPYMIPALIQGGKFAIDVLVHCVTHDVELHTLLWLFENCNVDVNMRLKDYNNQTFLHLALRKTNNPQIVRYLVETQNADLYAVDGDLNTPLHVAAQCSNNSTIVEYLVKPYVFGDEADRTKYVVHVNTLNRNNETPLDLAHDRNRLRNPDLPTDNSAVHIARCLEENGCVTGKQLIDDLVRAVTTGAEFHEELPSLFDTCHVNVNKHLKDYNNQTFLHLAVSKNDCLEVVRFLVEHKNAPLYDLDEDFNTPLHVAAQYSDNVKIVEYLVIKVHEKNCINGVNTLNRNNETPLDLAHDRNRLRNPDLPTDNSAVHIARCLEENGCVTGKQLIDDLVRAVTTGAKFLEELPSLFENCNVDVNQHLKDYNNQTFLHLAVSKNDCLEVVKFLREYMCASLGSQDKDYNWPLHLAAQHSNNLKIVEYLVSEIDALYESPKPINPWNKKHQTPLCLAIDRGPEGHGIAKYLESVGGKLK